MPGIQRPEKEDAEFWANEAAHFDLYDREECLPIVTAKLPST
jgi:hypothetical protein